MAIAGGVGIALGISATAAAVTYLNSPAGQIALNQIAIDIHSIGKKMVDEISRIKRKSNGPQGIQYSLRATIAGNYQNVRGGVTYLEAGDVWKFGETTDPCSRYSQSWLSDNNLAFIAETSGNQVQIKIAEKVRIYGYFIMNLNLPPGNKIFR